MGLFSDLLGGLLGCLCGNGGQGEQPSQQHHTSATARPQVAQQPQAHAVYPPHPHPQQHPHQPPPAEQLHKPTEHKKHRKHGSEAHTPPHADHVSTPSSPGYPDANQQNQQNQHYVELRARANAAGGEMARKFEASHVAYARRDGAGAKQLSNEGKAKKAEMERLNEEAAEWIFRENNTDSASGEVDLHGLYVKEAIQYTEKSIEEARKRGDSKIKLIVGKGLHSTNQVAKLKPAIEELIQKHSLVAELDEHNSGVLIVNLDGQTTGQGPVMGSDQLTRSLEKKDGDCIIM